MTGFLQDLRYALRQLRPVMPHLGNPHSAWLILAMASTLAGNLTIAGPVANIIVAEKARSAARISFKDYFRVGLPITILTGLFGVAWLHFAS